MAANFSLQEYLEKQFGERYDVDFLSSLRDEASGTLDSKPFSITFINGKCLLISTNTNTKEVLEELLPVLTEVMGGFQPICSYDLQSEEGLVMPTLEWDIIDPEARIKDIVNDRAFSDHSKIFNLKLNNGKDISSYLESEEEKQKRIKNSRICGLDPGSIKDVEAIKNLSELDLYFMIDDLGQHIWYCDHEMYHGRIPKIDLTEECFALEYLVYQTTRFGVEIPEPQVDKHISKTPSYNAWYRFYSNHFKKVLTDEQWNEFKKLHKTGKDVSMFMPSGKWQDLLEKPVQKTFKNK